MGRKGVAGPSSETHNICCPADTPAAGAAYGEGEVGRVPSQSVALSRALPAGRAGSSHSIRRGLRPQSQMRMDGGGMFEIEVSR